MNSVKMSLVALMLSVVLLGCSGLGHVKDCSENKIQKSWRFSSQELSKAENIPQMQPVLSLQKAVEKSDITLFEKTLSTKLKNDLGKEGVDKKFKGIVQFFQEKKGKSEQVEFIVEDSSEKEGVIYIRKPCCGETIWTIVLNIIRDLNNWKINKFDFGDGCSCGGDGGGGDGA